ncbi:NB-ARC domain-containing protein [Corchorus olitorius]|uniref:NB-ARC domain-containing protein n=1 Tax=Corchorus olitorius TaxID=93759 RepID=A0A1R3JCP5_9ROSI|nr:NB-ARC domain-containing protein [Corchorus olitorius]
MSMAGEAAFSAFLELFAKLASYDHLLNFVTVKQVNQHLKEWQRLLPSIQAVVNDAEQKQMKDQNVKNWLAQLHGLAYDVEDILDEFAMEALHRKLHLHEDQASTNKVPIPISTWFTRFTNPSAFNFSKKMISKFEKISSRLNGLATQQWSLGLRKINGGAMFKARKASLQPRALVDETNVYGREKEKAEILEFLLRQNGNENGASMLQIVGVGGIGKTTLAQLVYNDSSIEKSFDHKAWICVSKDFDAILVICSSSNMKIRAIQSSLYVDDSRCTNIGSSYLYFLNHQTPPQELNQFCTVIDRIRITAVNNITGLSTSDVYQKLSMGFELSWEIYTDTCGKPSISQRIFFE